MTGKQGQNKKLPVVSNFDRRSFLKALGISGVAGVAACEQLPVRKLIPYLTPPEELTPGVPTHYSSTCTACPAACGLLITVRDGRPVKLEGHPEHPLSRGGLCALGQADIRGLYDAGRLTGPQLSGAAATWQQLDAQVRSALGGGSGSVEVLSHSITSPAARQTVAAFLGRFEGYHTEFDPSPGGGSAVLDAYEVLEGRRVQPSLHFEKADLVVSLGSDFLATGDNPVVHTKSYTARRAASGERGALRHVQIEGSLSLTGANADERWPARANERRALALWLLKSVAQRVGQQEVLSSIASAGVPAEPPLGDKAARLADYLYSARGKSIVISGSSDPGEQAAVALLNRVLGNEGQSIDLELWSEATRSNAKALDELRKRLAGGKVGALIVIGIDPVEQLPDGAEWAKWLAAVPISVAITDRPTATAAAAKAVAAAHHGLESWYDFQPRADVMTIAQPTIRPLYDTRHPFENFLVWSEAEVTDYREVLMASWRDSVFRRVSGPAGFDEYWFRSVAAGASLYNVRPDDMSSSATPLEQRPSLESVLKAGGGQESGELEVELVAQVGLRDGTRSFNPWLRELPDPLSRVSWTPTVAIAPSLAKKSGIEDGDLVSVQVGEHSVQMPARVTPGQHPSVLGVPVGYGRQDGDRSQAPRNAYLLGAGAATLKATGHKEDLPLAQIHSSPEGRPIIHQVAKYDEHIPAGHHGEAHSLWNERPKDSPHWHMSINLDACTGCGACVVSCQAENNTAVVGPVEVGRYRDMYWLHIDRYFVGEEDNPDVLFEPRMCAQCDHAPCETVCPAAATVHSHDGLNMQAYNRCVGTRYCANNCPYKVRRFNWFQYEHGEPVERMVLNPDVVVRERGVMEKCTFCIQRIQLARIEARKEGSPVFEVKTACQQSCPADAIRFGDGANAESAVSQDRHNPRAFQVLADLGVEPSITYLARVRSRES